MKIPNFMLKKLYQKRSLSNNDTGCQFSMINPFMFDLIIGGKPMLIDGEEIPVESVSFSNGDQSMKASELSPENYFKFVQKTPIEVRIADRTLKPGKHRVVLRVELKGAGDFEFTFDDSI